MILVYLLHWVARRYLLGATSVVGLAATRHLSARGHITQLGAWVGHAVYGTKPIMALLPEASLVGAGCCNVLCAIMLTCVKSQSRVRRVSLDG